MKNFLSLFTIAFLLLAISNRCEAQLPVRDASEPGLDSYSCQFNLDDECPNSTAILTREVAPEGTDKSNRITLERVKSMRVFSPGIGTRQTQPSQETTSLREQDRMLAELISESPAEQRVDLIVRALTNARRDSAFSYSLCESQNCQGLNSAMDSEACIQTNQHRPQSKPNEPLDQIQMRLTRLEGALSELSQTFPGRGRSEPQGVANPFCLPRYSRYVHPDGSELPWAGDSRLPQECPFADVEASRLAELQGEIHELEQMFERTALRISRLLEQLPGAGDLEARLAKPGPMNLR